jgi:hypothetical protein
MNESYEVKHNKMGETTKKFDTLDAAIEYINDGMKNRTEKSYILYNDAGKEMIWLDHYSDRDQHFLGYSAARHLDKSVNFDKEKGLYVDVKLEDNKTYRDIVNHEMSKLKRVGVAMDLLKNYRFVADKSEPSHIDFDKKEVHYNEEEQSTEACQKLIQQWDEHKKTEAVAEDGEELMEIFGLGKKKKAVHVVAIKSGKQGTFGTNIQEGDIDVNRLAYLIKEILRKHANIIKEYSGFRSAEEIQHYFRGAVLHAFKFACTDAEYQKIQQEVSLIKSKDITYLRKPSMKANVNSVVMWADAYDTYNESIEDAVDNWYKQEW